MPRLSREAVRIIMPLIRKVCQYLTQTGAILFVWDPVFLNSSGLKIMNCHLPMVGALHPSLTITLLLFCVAELQILSRHLLS